MSEYASTVATRSTDWEGDARRREIESLRREMRFELEQLRRATEREFAQVDRWHPYQDTERLWRRFYIRFYIAFAAGGGVSILLLDALLNRVGT